MELNKDEGRERMEQSFKILSQIGKDLLQLSWWEIADSRVPILIEEDQTIRCCTFSGKNIKEAQITVYTGYEGIKSYLNMNKKQWESNSDKSVEFKNSLYRQRGLQFTLEASEPAFYRLNPGQFPQKIKNANELIDLIAILSLLLESFKYIKNKNLVSTKEKWLHVIKANQNWSYSVTDAKKVLANIPSQSDTFCYQNDLKVFRLKKLKRVPETIEGTQFFAPPQIWDHELQLELIPMVTTFVNHSTKDVYLCDLSSYKTSNLEKISDKLADTLLIKGVIPHKIVVDDLDHKDLISDFCRQLEIQCECGTTEVAKCYRNTLLGL